jgi:hypothetical protein
MTIVEGAYLDTAYGNDIPPEQWKQKRWGVQDLVFRITNVGLFRVVIETSVAGIAIGPFSQFNSLQIISRDPLPKKTERVPLPPPFNVVRNFFPKRVYSLTPEQPIIFPLRGGRGEDADERSMEIKLSDGFNQQPGSTNSILTMDNRQWPSNAGAPGPNNPTFQPPTLHLRIAYAAADLSAINLLQRSPQGFGTAASNEEQETEELKGTWAIFGRQRLNVVANVTAGASFRLGYFMVDGRSSNPADVGHFRAWPRTGYLTGPASGFHTYIFHDDKIVNGAGFLQLYTGPSTAPIDSGALVTMKAVVKD